MADKDNENMDIEGDEAQAPKKSPMVMILAGVIVLLLAGGGAFFFLKGGTSEAAAAETEAETEKLGTLVQMESFILNLNEAKYTRYQKNRFSVEHGNDELKAVLDERKDVVRDRVLTYLSGLSVDEVRGSEPKETIREAVTQKINEACNTEDGVRSVLFTEFVVQ